MIAARALVCDAKQKFLMAEVRLKEPAPDQLCIRTHYSGVSIGTEFALIRNKISWGPYPLCTGYQGTGVIESVGEAVRGFAPGDSVYFRGNDFMELADGRALSSVSGAHCSRVVTRPHTTHGVAPMVSGASMESAAMFVMPAVGLYGVDMANPRMGQTVVVHGVGLIGLGVVAACAHRGCVVVAVDLSARQLEIAREMGADHLIDARAGNLPAELKKIAPDGADVVFECTGLPECIDQAIVLCREHGSFVWQGNYGAAPLQIHFLPPHGRRLRMFFPCDDGLEPCRRAVVKNMAMGSLRWEKCITHRVKSEEAPGIYDRINRGSDPGITGVVIDWRS